MGAGVVTVPKVCCPSAPAAEPSGPSPPITQGLHSLQKPLERAVPRARQLCLRVGMGRSEGGPGREPRYLVVMKNGVCVYILSRGHIQPQFPHEVHLVGEHRQHPWAGRAVSTKPMLWPHTFLDLCSPPLLMAGTLLPTSPHHCPSCCVCSCCPPAGEPHPLSLPDPQLFFLQDWWRGHSLEGCSWASLWGVRPPHRLHHPAVQPSAICSRPAPHPAAAQPYP